MMNNNFESYLESVKEDVRNYLENDYDLQADIQSGQFQDMDDIETYLYDTLWINDSVTGNASGSYTFNRSEAKAYVMSDTETVTEALQEFGVSSEEIAERFLSEDWEYLDVTARCYVLGSAIAEVLDEIRDEIETTLNECNDQ